MNRREFWAVIEDARARVPDATDADAVAEQAVEILAAMPRERITAAAQPFRDLMADSYRDDLWSAADLINGGATDDGFDLFRGWLITQGREVFERAVADPDTLADHPAVRVSAAQGTDDLECGAALGIAWNAHLRATGEELPEEAVTTGLPPGEADEDFDDDQVRSRLPRLARLFLD